jgi:NADH dehydrogenase (ubiquinone) 1 beta subcomplex subunit 7
MSTPTQNPYLDEDRTMKVTQKELQNARIDLAYRDHCSHLLIPLNKCRRQTFYMPYECSHERHEYEKCQYFE